MQRGFVLAVDYGFPRHEYYAPTRITGTLSAYANHRREPDPLARPGEIDLTAHVEFDSIIEAAKAAGLRLEGFTDQHHFTVGIGAEHFADGANAAERRDQSRTVLGADPAGSPVDDAPCPIDGAEVAARRHIRRLQVEVYPYRLEHPASDVELQRVVSE